MTEASATAGDIPMVKHYDPFKVNRFKPADPRYLEREIAMQRESRALAEKRHPRGTKLRVADFWRLYYQTQASVDSVSAQVQTARSGSANTGRATTSRSVASQPTSPTAGGQKQQSEATAVAELNAPVPAGGNATCIGVVDGGLTIIVGRENGRVAVVDGLRGRLVQDIDVALAARERVNPRRREVQAALKLQNGNNNDAANGDGQDGGSAAQPCSIVIPAEDSSKDSASGAQSTAAAQNEMEKKPSGEEPQRADDQQKQQSDDSKTAPAAAAAAPSQKKDGEEDEAPLCPTDAQEKAMEKDPETGHPRDSAGLNTEAQPITCITPFTPRGLGRPMFVAGSAHGKLFVFDATTLTYLAQVDLAVDDKIEEMRWLAENAATTELVVRNSGGDLFVVDVTASDTPGEQDVRNIEADVRVSKRRDAVPKGKGNGAAHRPAPPTIVSMVALGGTVWVGDKGGGIHTLDDQDLGRVQFASEDFPLYAVQSDADDPAVNAVAVGGSFCYAAVEDRIHVLPLTGMPKDCIPLSTLTAHKARVVSLDFDHATGRLWSRDVSGFVACYDGTSKSGFALRTTMQLPTDGQTICDIKFCSYETHVRLWTLASNGLNKQWCSGFAAGSTDATNQASLNEADLDLDDARTEHWAGTVARELSLVDKRRAEGARALCEYDRTRVLAEYFAAWFRFRRLKKFLRIQPFHALMLTKQQDLALIGRTFRRWLHFRLQRRVQRIQAGGARLLLARVQEEQQAAYFRRWLQLVELRRVQRAKQLASKVLGDSAQRIMLSAYYAKWKGHHLRLDLKRRRDEMGAIVYDRWRVSQLQACYDTLKRHATQRKAKRLAEASVSIMGQRLNTIRMTQAFELWKRVRVQRNRRQQQQRWAESCAQFVAGKRRQQNFHDWLLFAARKREGRHAAENAAVEGKVAAAQSAYLANQAHIDRVQLLKTLRKQVADLQAEKGTIDERLQTAEGESKSARAEMVAARERACATSKFKGTVIGAAEVVGRAMLGQEAGADYKAAQAAAKEGPVTSAKHFVSATRALRDSIDAAEINQREVPVLDTDIDAFGAKIGKDKAGHFVDEVRKVAVYGLGTSLDAVQDPEIVDDASSRFVLENVDGLALSAVRLHAKPPPALVAPKAARSASGRSRSAPRRSGSATGKKAPAPAAKGTKAPAGKRPALRGKH